MSDQSRRSCDAPPSTTRGGSSVLDTIGNTPVVELSRLHPIRTCGILVKLEGANPSGSVKDRIARHLVEEYRVAGGPLRTTSCWSRPAETPVSPWPW